MKNKFIELFNQSKHRMDFVFYAGGCGGEYIALKICELSDDYGIIDNHQDKINANRWTYGSPAFDSWWMILGKISRNFNREFNTIEKIADEWDKYYSEDDKANQLMQASRAFTDKSKRFLFRSHESFKGFDEVFPDAKHISIVPKDPAWYTYVHAILCEKVLSYPYVNRQQEALSYCETIYKIANNTENYGKDSIIDHSLFIDRMKHVILHTDTFNAHSALALVVPKNLSYNMDVGYSTLVNKLLSIDPLEYNKRSYFWNNIPKGIKVRQMHKPDYDPFSDKYSANKDIMKRFYDIKDKDNILCVAEAVEGTKISRIFNLDASEFKEQMDIWHQNNMKMIKKTEDTIGGKILNDEFK